METLQRVGLDLALVLLHRSERDRKMSMNEGGHHFLLHLLPRVDRPFLSKWTSFFDRSVSINLVRPSENAKQ